MNVQVPIGFRPGSSPGKSQSGFKFQSELWLDLSIKTWVRVPIWGVWFQIYHCTFAKLTGCITPRVNPKVHYGLWVIILCQCMSLAATKAPIWWDMFTVREVEGGCRGHFCTFCLNLLWNCSKKWSLFKRENFRISLEMETRKLGEEESTGWTIFWT